MVRWSDLEVPINFGKLLSLAWSPQDMMELTDKKLETASMMMPR